MEGGRGWYYGDGRWDDCEWNTIYLLYIYAKFMFQKLLGNCPWRWGLTVGSNRGFADRSSSSGMYCWVVVCGYRRFERSQCLHLEEPTNNSASYLRNHVTIRKLPVLVCNAPNFLIRCILRGVKQSGREAQHWVSCNDLLCLHFSLLLHGGLLNYPQAHAWLSLTKIATY